MRKLLLASAAVFGGSLAITSGAFAQAPAAPAAVYLPSLQGGVPATTALPIGGSGYTAAPSLVAPGPNQVTVRFQVLVEGALMAGSDSGRNPGLVTTASSPTGNTVTPANTKLQPYQFLNYARFYPGFDGIASNGMQYGGKVEVRENAPTGSSNAPGGGVAGSISQSSTNRGVLFFRRAYVYLGADSLGSVRLGMTDGALSLQTTGTMEYFDAGGWNGDLEDLFTGNTELTIPFPENGVNYTTEKVVYMSPQFFGFDFGVSFEPTTATSGGAPGNCGYANTAASTGSGASGCDATSATTVQAETARRRNTVEVSGRYRNSFGPFGISANLGGIFSGKVENNNTPAVKATQVLYNGVATGNFGTILTYGPFAVGGNLVYGNVNGDYNLQAKGTKNETGYVVGGSYNYGPFIVGAYFINTQSAGSKTRLTSPWVGNRNEWGVAVGGTYGFAPGMNLFLSYLYGHRKENGVDLLTGVTSAGSTAAGRVYTHNNVQAQGVEFGYGFKW